jgi:hypothetical protein
MSSTLALLILLMVVALIWLDGARAREFATILARRYCANRGMQFLDETVSLARLGVRWTRQGLRIRRMFRFEFSLEGVGRRTGYVLMLGSQLETIDDGLPRAAEPEEQANPRPAAGDEHKVIPFRRRDP